MKKSLPLIMLFACIFTLLKAQSDSSAVNTEKRRLIDLAQKQYLSRDYYGALDNINKTIDQPGKPDDDILYFKIQVLQKIYTKSNELTTQLDNTLQSFFKQVNQYTFPEDKYSNAGDVKNALNQFKKSDQAFADTVKAKLNLQDLPAATALNDVINNYLKANPNSYQTTYLNSVQHDVTAAVQHAEGIKKQIAKDSANKRWLKRAGRTGISFSYAIPNSTIKAEPAITKVSSFFNGSGEVAMGAKFAAGLSVVDIIIPVITTPQIRFSFDWNLFDAEYYQFNWSMDSSLGVDKLHALKAGTRIGPSISIHITKKINACFYYSARPGVQLAIGKLDYEENDGSSSTSFSLKPAGNFNLSNEIGGKLRFGKFTINPFYHFGKFEWKNDMYDYNDSKIGTLQTSYKFSYVGLRISI